ncbi:ABC transporter ATP-binding protein [Thermococcus sibiricus MM 739]|uniref:ABC transporter ATP-binding protein n=1 Tax=Thermococcus sibiricus (strain DSM 12597 / MM 739) TaxID=604354 RepID=C6A3D9_THESM|nr:ABC transporter ATP-binding protein [Thermococcus sibiricus MM 739]
MYGGASVARAEPIILTTTMIRVFLWETASPINLLRRESDDL